MTNLIHQTGAAGEDCSRYLVLKSKRPIQTGTNSGKADWVDWKNLSQGGPEGSQTFLKSASRKESLITRGTSDG